LGDGQHRRRLLIPLAADVSDVQRNAILTLALPRQGSAFGLRQHAGLSVAGIEDTQRWTFFESQQDIKDVNEVSKQDTSNPKTSADKTT